MTHSLFGTAAPNPAGYRDVEPSQVRDSGGAGVLLVDVREPAEYTGELGHVKGSRLAPLGVVTAVSSEWSKDAEIVLICRSGGRSGRAATDLVKHGFTRVMNMKGGMLAWNAQGLPVER